MYSSWQKLTDAVVGYPMGSALISPQLGCIQASMTDNPYIYYEQSSLFTENNGEINRLSLGIDALV